MKKISLFFVAIFILFLLPISVSAASHGNNIQSKNCPLKPGNFYTYETTKSVWQVVPSDDGSCTKRALKSSKVYFTYENSWDAVKTVSADKINSIKDDPLGFLPWGPKYNPKGGALVKTLNDEKVYLLLNGKKYWITDENKFQELNYKWSWIEDVNSKLLDKFESEGQIDFTDHHPVGSLIKDPRSSRVYQLENKQGQIVKRHIEDSQVFNKLDYRFDRVVMADKNETYPTGTPITMSNYKEIMKNETESMSKKSTKRDSGKNLKNSFGKKPTTTEQRVTSTAKLYPARKDGKWGYIGKSGDWKIKPKFNYAKPFFQGRATVNILPSTTFDNKDSKWGIINKKGNFVVKPSYYSTSASAVPSSPIGHYSQGLAPVNASRTFGSYKKATSAEKTFYFDRSGKKKLADKFQKIGQFSDGLAPFVSKENSKIGYINKRGEVVIEPQYDEGLLYSDGLVPVRPEGKTFGGWKFINKQGKVVLEGPYREANSFHNGLALVEENDEMKYIGTKGNTVFKVDSFGSNTSFREDVAIVTKSKSDFEDYKAIVNKKGKVISNLSDLGKNICAAEPFHHGLAQIIISQDGSCITSSNRPTSEGMLDAVSLRSNTNSLYAYVDKKGNVVYEEKPSSANKVMNSVPKEERKKVKQLFTNSKKAVENENWKEYLKKYTEKGRTNLLKKYYTSLTFAIGFASALSDSSTTTKKSDQEDIDQLKKDWKQLLKDFGFYSMKDTDSSEKKQEDKLAKKFENMSLDRKAEFLSRLIGLFKKSGEDKKPQFGKLIDFKVQGDKGAILIEREDSDGDTEEKSETIIKKSGSWKWSEPFLINE